MADLGLNTLVDAVKNLTSSATGGYDKMVDFIEAFRSDDANNPYGTAALKDVGTAQGDVPELGTGGKLAAARLPDATATAKGAVELATTAEGEAGTDTARAMTAAATKAAIEEFAPVIGSLVKCDVYTTAGTHSWTRATGVTSIRVEAVGAAGRGGDGYTVAASGKNPSYDYTGGTGAIAGYADGLIDVTNISSATVKVGDGASATQSAHNSEWLSGTTYIRGEGGGNGANASSSGSGAHGTDGGGASSGAMSGSVLTVTGYPLYKRGSPGGAGHYGSGSGAAGAHGFVRVWQYT